MNEKKIINQASTSDLIFDFLALYKLIY